MKDTYLSDLPKEEQLKLQKALDECNKRNPIIHKVSPAKWQMKVGVKPINRLEGINRNIKYTAPIEYYENCKKITEGIGKKWYKILNPYKL